MASGLDERQDHRIGANPAGSVRRAHQTVIMTAAEDSGDDET